SSVSGRMRKPNPAASTMAFIRQSGGGPLDESTPPRAFALPPAPLARECGPNAARSRWRGSTYWRRAAIRRSLPSSFKERHVTDTTGGKEKLCVRIGDVVRTAIAESGGRGVDCFHRPFDLEERAYRRLVHDDLHVLPGIGLAVFLVSEDRAQAERGEQRLEVIGLSHRHLDLLARLHLPGIQPRTLVGQVASLGSAPQAEQAAAGAEPSGRVVEQDVVLEMPRAEPPGAETRHRGPRGFRSGDAELDLALDLARQSPRRGADYSTTRTVISVRSLGLSRASRGSFTMLSATSIPRTTRPKAVYCRSRKLESFTTMKNWEPALLGSWARAMETTPRLWGTSLNSALIVYPGPPVPWRSRPALRSFVLGSPPWIMKPGITL